VERAYLGRILFLAIVAAVLAAAFFSPLADRLTIDSLRESRASLMALVAARPLLSIAVFFMLTTILTTICFPVAPLIGLSAGAMFGFWPALPTVLLASTLGSTVAFLTSRHVLRDWVKTKLSPRLPSLDATLERHGPAALLTLRWNPFIPYWLVNLLMGVTTMRLTVYVPLTLIGLFPATFIYVTAGTQLATLRSAADIASPGLIASLVALSLLPLAAARLTRGR
jgi:uncharacterized membrane protein YdjX (TVP38/TMEM64 family)